MEYVHPGEREMGATQEPYGLALNEIARAEDLGHDVTALRRRLTKTAKDDDTSLLQVYADTPRTRPKGSPHSEDSRWHPIEAKLPPAREASPVADRAARVEGAWMGRIVGNMLGKPVEWQWPRGELEGYLRERNAWPLTDYIPIDAQLRFAVPDSLPTPMPGQWFYEHDGLSRGEITGGVRDDDVDFTILGLHLLETWGPNYTTYDVAHEWLSRFPLNALYTAERAAYNNLVRGVPLDEVGEHHNPYRDWIGALIRADIHGYLYAGDPRRAARSVHPDAWISHRGTGIHGALWAAALIATAFTSSSPAASIDESLNHVPARSRLADEVNAVRADFAAGKTWAQALTASEARTKQMSFVHTINNAGALTAAILWGGGDFTSTIALAVLSGLDTDSIGATAGSWAGAFTGIDGIPPHWVQPLNGRTVSAVFGYGEVNIADLVDRTLALTY